MIYGKYNALVSGAHLAKHLYLHIFAIRQPIKASRLRAQILPPMTQKKGNTNTTNTPNTTTTIVFVSLTRYILFSQNTHGHGGLKRPISHIGWFFLLVFIGKEQWDMVSKCFKGQCSSCLKSWFPNVFKRFSHTEAMVDEPPLSKRTFTWTW